MPSIAAAAAHRWPWPIRPWGKRCGRKWSPSWGPAGRARRSIWACFWTCSRGNRNACRSSPAGPFPSACNKRPCRPWHVASSRQDRHGTRVLELDALRNPSRRTAAGGPPPLAERLSGRTPRKNQKPQRTRISTWNWSCPTWPARRSSKRSNTRKHSYVVRSLLRNSAAAFCLIDAAELGRGQRGRTSPR